jgi:hypothetical protein
MVFRSEKKHGFFLHHGSSLPGGKGKYEPKKERRWWPEREEGEDRIGLIF